LKPQHLEAVLTAAKLCNAEVKGATLRSQELWFTPHEIKGGKFEAEIGTAGSIPMLLLTVLPMCAVAKEPVQLHISKGGTDTWSAPTINYVRFVLLPTLRKMGFNAEIMVHRYGYYPKGMGEVTLTVQACRELLPIRLENFGDLRGLKGYSVCTFLAERKVAQRQAEAANKYLTGKGYKTNIEIVDDTSNPLQRGSSICLWTDTDTGTILGADAIGELRKFAEAVGTEAAQELEAEISAKPTVDVHLSDMLIPYMALAEGSSVFFVRTVSDHLEANIWLAEKMLNAKFNIQKTDGLFRVEKL
jgi:RNA 3'-terminal phosphate cyclase (ATP)